MGVNINTKPTITTIDNNDQIFISDDGVALKKISYTDLAKAIIEQYNASQLAGSTKTVQTAINDLNDNKMNVGLGEVIPNGANLNNYITIGTYRVTSSAAATSITNTPFDSPYMLDVRQGVNADTIIQEVLKHGALMEKAERRYNASNNTWTNWRYPERKIMWPFNNTTTLTSQAEALPEDKTIYFGYVSGYTHQAELDIPANANGYVEIYRLSVNCITMKFVGINNGLTGSIYTRNKYSTWGDWVKLPTRTEIDDLNSKSVGDNAGGHNSIFRGKSLGSSVSAAQWSAISAGTFDDLFIGDYWKINSIVWRIAAFNYWYNTGNANCTTPHVVIVPDSNLLNGDGSTTHWMNTSNTTEGGYMGTGWYTGENADGTANTGKSQCLSKVESAFGSGHILQHREYLSNAVTNGYVSGGMWADSKIELMNESMVYGNRFFENVINGTNIPAAYTIDKGQLPLFALAPQYICNRATWWLRSVVSSARFACVGGYGDCYYSGASHPGFGLRPAFGIK